MANNNLINKKPDTNRTQHSVGVYGASGALSGIGPLTNGQTIIGSTGTNPVASSISTTYSSITITNGVGTIDLATNFVAGTSAFLAYLNSNQANLTGDGTGVVVPSNTEVYDIGADYNTGTYTFTCDATGKYYISTNCFTYNLAAGHTSYITQIITSNRNYYCHVVSPGPLRNTADNGYVSNAAFIADMDSGDTAYQSVQVSGSTKVVGIGGLATNIISAICGWRLS